MTPPISSLRLPAAPLAGTSPRASATAQVASGSIPVDRVDLAGTSPKPPVPSPKPPANPTLPAVDENRVKDLFLELVQIKGATGNERKVADTIVQKLGAMGYTPREDGAAAKVGGNTGNLLLDVPGTITDAPTLVLMAHMDTVPLAVGVKPQIRDGVIYSDGKTALGGDNRAGCTELLETLRLLKDNNVAHGPLQIIFTVGEEGGLLGSSALERKDVHGHLGYAVDSFHPNDIFWGWDGPLFAPDHTGVHAAKARAQEAFNRPATAADELQPRNNAEGFLLDFTRQGIRDIGMQPSERSLYGASSDAAALRDMGIPAMTIGAGEQDIHTRKEHISIADLKKSTELIMTLVNNATAYQVDGSGHIKPRA